MIYTDGIHIAANRLRELHCFAVAAGIKRCWFHNHKDHPHYDKPKRYPLKRLLEIGALPVSSRTVLRIAKTTRMSISSIRVGNKRAGANPVFQPDSTENIINIDRGNPLGNPYKMCASLTRKQCIALFKADLLKDIREGGPLYQELLKICEELERGWNVILMCWCKPCSCHGDVIVEQVEKLLQNKLLTAK